MGKILNMYVIMYALSFTIMRLLLWKERMEI